MTDSPCRGCAIRHKSCHQNCDEYHAYAKRKADERLRERMDNLYDSDVLRQLQRPQTRPRRSNGQ